MKGVYYDKPHHTLTGAERTDPARGLPVSLSEIYYRSVRSLPVCDTALA